MNWDRVVAPAATVTVPLALVLTFYGKGYEAVALAAGLGSLVLVVRRRARRRRGDVSWAVSAENGGEAATPARGSIALALARVEARELLLSPWFGAGLGFCVILGALGAPSFERSWWVTAGLMPLLVHPLCGMTIVGTHRNVTRSRRDNSEELFESCPATSQPRTTAYLLTMWVPILVATIFVVGTLVAAGLVLDNIYGPIDDRVFADVLLAAILLPAGAVALGVLLGRRARFALAPFVAIAVIALLNLEFWDDIAGGRGWLATGIPSRGIDFIYFEPPVAGRLLWIAGLVIAVSGLAVATSRRSKASLLAGLGLVVAMTGIVLAVRPLSDATAERLAEYVIAPDDHEVCHTLTASVRVCALEPYKEHGAALAAHVAPVADELPAGVFDTPITMRLLAGDHLEELPDEVRQRIVPTPIPKGTVALPFSHHDGSLDEARFLLAATAVGLATGEDAPENILVDGEARGVVLLWLATAGLPRDDALDLLEPDRYNENTPSGQGHIWPGICGAQVQWAPQDLVAAREMLSLERPAATRVVDDGWARWTDTDASTDDLLVALGLATVGPPDPIEPLGSPC